MPGFENIIAQAISTGIEINLEALINSADLSSQEPLIAVVEVMERVTKFGLRIEPAVQVGDLRTTRLLSFPQIRIHEELQSRTAYLCDAGESQRVEFKSSLCADLRRYAATGQLHQREELEGECLKTVCAFLNSDGGQLLIGISDDGQYSRGIEYDCQVKNFNEDHWFLHWVERLKTRFHEGLTVLPYVRSEIFEYDGGPVCLVSVNARSEPSFVKLKAGADWEFFARFGPRSESLGLPDFHRYMKMRKG